MTNCETEQESKNLVYLRGATDVEFFAQYFFPHYCTNVFNRFHEGTFDSYEYGKRGVRKADAAPRGYAKSTIEALIKLIHDVCYKLEQFVLIISNTEAQAKQKLKDIRAEFLENDALLDIYSEIIASRKSGETDYIIVNGEHKVRFLAIGSKTEIRGIRFGAARPSKIVCDDIEHSTEVESEEIRDKYEDLFKDVISKVGNTKTNIHFIGTVLHRKSLLANLIKNPRYKSEVYKAVISWATNKSLWNEWEKIYCEIDNEERAIDALAFYEKNEAVMMEGVEVLWPEEQSYYYLMEEIIETGYRSFMKEKQNSPMSDEEKIFTPEDSHFYDAEEFGIRYNGILIPWEELVPYGALDPSTGQVKARKTKKGDFTCALTGYTDRKGRLFVHHDWTKRVAPSVYIKKVFQLHEEFMYEKFGVETNLYKELLLPNLVTERKRQEKELKKLIKLPFYDIHNVENKEKRIYTLEPKVNHGWIVFNRELSNEFMDQLWEFPKGDHDDGPDTLEMLWNLVHNKYKVSSVSKNRER